MTLNSETFLRLLSTGVKHGASDIHFRPGSPPLSRVNKNLVPLKAEPLTPQMTRAAARMILANRAEDLDDLHEVDTSYSLPGVARFRVSIYRQRSSIGLVLRIIPSRIRTIPELDLPPVLSEIALYERGLILVSGATGSGKTTTLAAMLDHINDNRMGHILTIEDPIEFLHNNKSCSVTQREIGLDTKTFVTGMRAALRQDPDVILVGEMRDIESIDIGLKAAETGHVVFSTVHTTDAEKTIGRILAVFPPGEQHGVRLRLAESLRAVVSQRLLPAADGKGMVLAAEVMIVTGTIREIIRDPSQGSIRDAIEAGGQHYHMQSFDQHLTDLLRAGQISMGTAMSAATNPSDLQRNLSFG